MELTLSVLQQEHARVVERADEEAQAGASFERNTVERKTVAVLPEGMREPEVGPLE
jgi:hypothetical protein